MRKKQTTKKPAKKYKRRIIRKSPDPLTKLDAHYIALQEIYRAARKAGFSEAVALYLMSDKNSMPDWVVGDGGIIPSIDPTEEDED